MTDKKPTDAEIKSALKGAILNAKGYDSKIWSIEVYKLEFALDLINCLQADVDNYKQIAENQQKITMDRGFEIKRLKEKIESLQAENKEWKRVVETWVEQHEKDTVEIERLKNAYKQVAWERDIFAEDMKQEIKKDCSYLMLDIKTIKAEAYKEFSERVKKLPYYPSYTNLHKEVDNLLKELVGEDNG